jgi:outer membrane usher protein
MVVVFAVICFIPVTSRSAETVILTVSLNTISHGEFFLKRNADQGMLMRSADLQQIGLKIATAPVTTIDSVLYIALSELSGVTVTLDEKRLLLDLRAGATWVDLPHVIRNYSPASTPYVPPPGTSAFFNYRVDGGNDIDLNSITWSATGQSGLRRGNLLLMNDGFYRREEGAEQAVRLMTGLAWDRPASVSRWQAGDINATAGDPSGPVLIGGIGYASAYGMAPGLILYPMGEFGGVATLPSEAEIYINGVLARREYLAPGDYRFQNLPVSSGANNVEIVLRDAFGNEQRTSTRFYLSDQLLKSGIHDYSYNAGFLRRDYGRVSNDYGYPLLVSRHAYGVNDYLTVGAGFEAGNDLANLMPHAVISLRRAGILNLQAAQSRDRIQGWGTRLGVGYLLQSRFVNYHANLSHSTAEFRTLSNQQATDTVHMDGGTGISVGSHSFGTVSLNGAFSETSAGLVTRSLGVVYSRSLAKMIQFSASVNSTWGTSAAISFFTALTFFPANNLSVSAMLQGSQDSDIETLSLQKNLPVGEGIGYRAVVERLRVDRQTLVRANPSLQVNGAIGHYSVDLSGQFNQENGSKNGSKTGQYQISAAGAVVYAGGHVGLTRPVSSGFGVVQVEGVADVMVLLDNQEVARTNAHGLAFLPMLQPYQENRVAFKDSQIAANYLIKRYAAIASPGLFGGECLYFPVARIQAYGGNLLAEDGRPLEYARVTLRGMGKELSFVTLKGGEFYIENLVDSRHESSKRPEACGESSPYQLTIIPGTYAGTVVADGVERHFTLIIPVSNNMLVALGTFRLTETPQLK